MYPFYAGAIKRVVIFNEAEMTKAGRPERTHSDDARMALIVAAKHKFVHKPYDKVSIRELAELAGVNSAMIKYYFENKEGLYKAMVEDVTGQVMSKIEQQLASGQFNTIEGFFRSFVEVVKLTPEFPMLMLKELILNQGGCRDYFLERIGNKHMALIDQVFKHFKATDKLRDDLDPQLFRMSLMSLTIHPWHMRELLGKVEGLEYDDEFLEAMIKHNTQLIQYGCFKENDNGQ